MNPAQQLSGLRYRMMSLVEEMDEVMQELEKERRNVRLTKREANQVMGYKDPGYIYRLEGKAKEDFEQHIDEHGFIRYNDLWIWAQEHKPNRLKYMKNNIKDFK